MLYGFSHVAKFAGISFEEFVRKLFTGILDGGGSLGKEKCW
ncbi:hypothetical protein [Thermofilum adornatum]|nr:hypothetical protein [Thermofilum adornatum]